MAGKGACPTFWRPVRYATFQLMPKMVCVGRKQFQVLWSVVTPIPIQMVDNFFRIKAAAKYLLHYEAMLSNVALVIGIGVIVHFQENIPAFVNVTPTSPKAIPPARSATTTTGNAKSLKSGGNPVLCRA